MAKRKKFQFSMTRLFYPLLSRLMRLWVREQVLPADLEIDRSRPVVYVLESDALSNLLILQQACHDRNLPMPLDELPVRALEMRSVMPMQRLRGIFFRRPDLKSHLRRLADMIEVVEKKKCKDLQLIPVSIFLGRAPDKETGAMRILFSENWPIAGRLRRLVSILIHGRATLVQFSKPISLREQVEEAKGKSRTVRKISRVLRVHFRRVRASVIGPDLSHRRTVVDDVLRAPRVREAIKQSASRNNRPVRKVRREARKYAEEIAADYSYPLIRILSRLLTWFWNKIYNGVKVNHLHNLLDVTEGTEIIYVPCHRSHIDYLIASYLVYHNGVAVPHIAAGVNLNIPIVGSILRRGGAFFLRRSFRANALYSAVFNQYVETIFAKGVSLEYFIEGTRSRTGRLLEPRTGMLAMTVRSFLRNPERPTVFVPIYLGYERLVEGGAYIGELSGGQKKQETLGSLLRSFRILKEQYGEMHVSFGTPIFLHEHLDDCYPNWKEEPLEPAEKPRWLSDCVDALGNRIMTHINAAADANPMNLVALALLSSPKNAMAEDDLVAQVELYQRLIRELPYSSLTTVTEMSADEVVRYVEEMGAISRKPHPLGDVMCCEGASAFLLSYFRNNSLHLTTVYSWCACVFMNNVTFSRKELNRLGRVIYPFIKGELFLDYDADDFVARCDKCLDIFVRHNLLMETDDPDVFQRAHGGSPEALRLRLLGESVFSSLERYYMVVALLTRHGSGTLTTGQLENLCHLTAQRLSMIYTLDTPDYFDKALFKRFIRQLKARRIVDTDDDGKLTFDPLLEGVVEDAKAILSKEVRHSILAVSPERTRPSAHRDAA